MRVSNKQGFFLRKKKHWATIQMRNGYLALLLFGGLRCIPGSMALRKEGGRHENGAGSWV